MVKIPDVPIAQRGLETVPAGVAPSIEQAQFGGKALEAIGRTLQTAQQTAQIKQQKEIKKQAEKSVTEATANFELDQLQNFENLKVEHDNIDTFTPTFQSNFDKSAEKLISETQTGIAQDMLREKLNIVRNKFTNNAIIFQSKQKIALKKEQAKSAVNTYANIITQNPDSWEDVLLQSETTFEAAKNFMPKAQQEKFVQDSLATLGEAKIRAEILRDTNNAEQLLKSKEIAATLGNNTLRSLNRELLVQKKKNEEINGKNIAAQIAASAIETGTPIDGKKKENRDAIDNLFEVSGESENLKALDVEAANQLTTIAQRTNYIPVEAQSILRSFLATGNKEQKSYAVDTIARLQEESPQSLVGFNKNEISESLLVTKYLRAGVSPDNAFTFAKEQINPLNKDVIDLRKSLIKKTFEGIFTDDPQDIITGIFDTFFSLEPDIPDVPRIKDAMVAEYKVIRDGFFLNTGDEDVTNMLTASEIKRFYGKTNVTGTKTVMKYPPENFYGIQGIDNSWIEKQFISDVRKATENPDLDQDNVFLLPDTRTAREAKANGSPSYLVLIKQDDGSIKELRDSNGKLLRQIFDSSEVIKKHDDKIEGQKKRRKELIDSIRKARQLEREFQREGFPIPGFPLR